MKYCKQFFQRVFIDHAGATVVFLALILFVLTVLKAKDLITGEIPRRENPAAGYSMLMRAFPGDFDDLLAYLRRGGAHSYGILWYPLNWANYIMIPENISSDGVFVGTSVVQDATRQRDFAGFYNFGPQRDFIDRSMIEGDYQPLCRAVRENNINVVIVNKALLNDQFRGKFSAFFSLEHPSDMFRAQQSPQFLDNFIGQKIASFGQGFDLHHIHSNLLSDRIEIYEGDALSEESNRRDWCSNGGVGRLDSQYAFNSAAKQYTVKTHLENVKIISIILPEKFGHRYHLVIEHPGLGYVESIEYIQSGVRFVSRVTFNKTVSGIFIGRFESNSIIEHYPIVIFLLQAVLLIIVMGYVIYSNFFSKSP
jgi:hypothetical protein